MTPAHVEPFAMIYRGDCVEVMAALPEASVDAVVTDPPYSLGFMGKPWDVQVEHGPWGREAFRVLKPGGHLVAFGGTRTFHRLTCALEDAGFEIRDCLSWLYGQGFPKSLNVGNGWGTALKPAWEPIILARKPLGERNVAANVLRHGTGALNVDGCRVGLTPEEIARSGQSTAGMFGLGRIDWKREGREPLGRWPANLVLDEAAAALLDAQSGERPSSDGIRPRGTNNNVYGKHRDTPFESYGDTGGASRFVKVVDWGAEDSICGDESTRAENTSAGKKTASNSADSRTAGSGSKQMALFPLDARSIIEMETSSTIRSATSNASRRHGMTTTISESEKIIASSSVGAASDAGSIGRSPITTPVPLAPTEAIAEPVRVSTFASGERETETGITPTCAPIAGLRFHYTAKADGEDRDGSKHPTVKPVDLMKWLIKLVTPPEGVILDPFLGSGTTVYAARALGIRSIGIEREAAYVAQAIHRLRQGVLL